ncbi:hypothetical protein [Streptomyces sp. NRRL F-5727]|uniref:hypothetical protein n=1 Tax=Streptomyces sp. NRRL F-5727 TaxID=1463871 RepID=UPI0004C62B73|nr:hypothetical protein [Streptomyces sp. NRRL F-5727]
MVFTTEPKNPAYVWAVHYHPGQGRTIVLITAIHLTEHPLVTRHQADLADHARRLPATSPDRHHRDRLLAALKAWGHDTSGLENASDIAAREHYPASELPALLTTASGRAAATATTRRSGSRSMTP